MITDETQLRKGVKSEEVGRVPASLKQQAYDALKRQILSGRLAPGVLLSERQLASELKMSKTPVHAALERLEAEDLVVVAAQQGIMVRAISPQDMSDHFEIREAIEPFVVAKLAGRLVNEQARRLEHNLLENDRAVREMDVEANVRLDAEFHLILCEFLGNREITRVMGQIREKVHGVIRYISSRHPERMAGSLAEHEHIAEAILAGNGPEAAERMKAHLRYGLQSIYDRHAWR
jgi:DNA-binding GntR family transcriptional regulator